MSEAEYQGAEEYAIYQAETGRLLSSGRSFAPETLLLPGQLLIKKIAPGALGDYYVENGELVKKSDQPSAHHIFDYTTKQWIDPRTAETEWPLVRSQRNALLYASDWTQLPDVPLANKETWAIYRQALRDITEQTDPFNINWPVQPDRQS